MIGAGSQIIAPKMTSKRLGHWLSVMDHQQQLSTLALNNKFSMTLWRVLSCSVVSVESFRIVVVGGVTAVVAVDVVDVVAVVAVDAVDAVNAIGTIDVVYADDDVRLLALLSICSRISSSSSCRRCCLAGCLLGIK